MKEKNSPLHKLWNILNDAEDYLKDGYRSEQQQISIVENVSDKAADNTVESSAKPNTADTAESTDNLEDIAGEVAHCTKCILHKERNKTVPGEGPSNPLVMCIGEAPGAEEDKQGRPFVGRAGQYLDKWFAAIGMNRSEHFFIGNILKCRPPGNRDPYPDEINLCIPYLKRQIQVLQPKVILTISRFAAQQLLDTTESTNRLRGQTHYYMGIPLIVTYHPSAVLRNPQLRAPVWEDLKQLRDMVKT